MCHRWGEAMKQPCRKDCPDRSGECHAVCEKYREFEKARNAEYEKKAVERGAEGGFFEGKERLRMRNYKKKKEWRWR